MPFELLTPTAAKLKSLTPRTEKHGDDEVSAISLGLAIIGPNTLLDHLDGGKLRHALYMAVPDQDQLPGVEPSTPLLRARGIDLVHLSGTLEGWTVIFDRGIADDSAIVMGGSKVDKFRVKPMEGGSVELLLRVSTSDISEAEGGALFGMLGQEVMVSIKAPVILPDSVIDGTVGHPGLAAKKADDKQIDLLGEGVDATTAFLSWQHDHSGGAPGAGDSDNPGDPVRGQDWPFQGGDGGGGGEAGHEGGAQDSAP